MQPSPHLFDLCALQRAEANYKECLLTQPDNLAVRLSLAWCLFIQALHQSGQETAIISNNLPYEQAVPPAQDTPVKVRDAQALLQDCLQHLYNVKHLSIDEEDRSGVERLQTLVELAGAKGPSISAETQSLQRLIELAWEIRHSADTDFQLPERSAPPLK